MKFDQDIEDFLNSEFQNGISEIAKMDHLIEWTGLDQVEIKKWFKLKRRTTTNSALSNNNDKVDAWFAKFPFVSYMSETEREKIVEETGLTIKAIQALWNKKRDAMREHGIDLQPDKDIKRRASNKNKVLYEAFEKSTYPDPEKISELATETGLTEKQVKNWFNQKRCHKRFTDIDLSLTGSEKTKLLTFWSENVEPIREELTEISNATGLEVQTVKDWFRGMRADNRIKLTHDFREHHVSAHPKEKVDIMKRFFEEDHFYVTGADEPEMKSRVLMVAEEVGLTPKQIISWFRCERGKHGEANPYPALTDEKLELIEKEFLIDRMFLHIEGSQIHDRCKVLGEKIGLAPLTILRGRKILDEKYHVAEKKAKLQAILDKHFEEQIICDDERCKKIAEEISEFGSMTPAQVAGWFRAERKRKDILLKGKIPKTEAEFESEKLLEGFFASNKKPTAEQHEMLATKTGMTVSEVCKWFWRKRSHDSYQKINSQSRIGNQPISALAIAHIQEEYKKSKNFGHKKISAIAERFECKVTQVKKQITILNEAAGVKRVNNPIPDDKIPALEKYFAEANHATFGRAAKIAKELDLTIKQVKHFFDRTRQRLGVKSDSKIYKKVVENKKIREKEDKKKDVVIKTEI